MKNHVKTTYECEVCGALFDSMKAAAACEATPVDVPQFKVGEFVGVQPHGWWGEDTSWALEVEGGDCYTQAANDAWEIAKPGPAGPRSGRIFLPLWRVVGIRPAFERHWDRHSQQYLLWSPRHANRRCKDELSYGEGLSFTYSRGHYLPLLIAGSKFHPKLTEEETARYEALVQEPDWKGSYLL